MSEVELFPVVNDVVFESVLLRATAHVSPDQLLKHLNEVGWRFSRYVLNEHAQEWVFPVDDADDDDPVGVVVPLPSLPNPADFEARMRTAIKFVASVEGWQLLAGMGLPEVLRGE
jgi:hypothetical protein